jgi:D-3-phosphoglycerate dehydrogenase
LAQENGKVQQLKKIGLDGKVWVIGDGYTDYQIREAGMTEKFIAFFENVERINILDKADQVVRSFDDFLKTNNLSNEGEKLEDRGKIGYNMGEC